MSGDLYRLRGVVTAPDGTAYRPLYWGDFGRVKLVERAIVDGCRERGDAFELYIDRGPGSGECSSWSGPGRAPDRAPFEVIGALSVSVGGARDSRAGHLSYSGDRGDVLELEDRGAGCVCDLGAGIFNHPAPGICEGVTYVE
jgi:hypothetical protein